MVLPTRPWLIWVCLVSTINRMRPGSLTLVLVKNILFYFRPFTPIDNIIINLPSSLTLVLVLVVMEHQERPGQDKQMDCS